MDTGISNISRAMGQPILEPERKQLQPVEKRDGAEAVSSLSKVDKFQLDELQSAEVTGLSLNENEQEDSEQGLAETVETINTALRNVNRSIQFNLDKDSGRTIITIIDLESGDEIKQIPSEEMLAISKRLLEQSEQMDKDDVTGMLVKSRV